MDAARHPVTPIDMLALVAFTDLSLAYLRHRQRHSGPDRDDD